MTQRVRRLTLFAAFVLFQFPLVHLLFSPVLPVIAASRGVVGMTIVTYGALAVAALVLGRAYCGWFCDGAAIQECCTALGARPVKGKRYWTKFIPFGLWVAAVTVAFARAGGIHSVDLGFGLRGETPIPHAALLYGPFLIHVPLTILLGRWAWCHYGCWIAPWMILASRLKERVGWPSLRIAAEPEKCLDCQACADACPMSLEVPEMVRARARSDECVLCGQCVEACATGAVRFSFSRP